MYEEQLFMRRQHPMFGMSRYRDPHYRPQYNKRKPVTAAKRMTDPKEFTEVYENPLINFMPLLEYFTVDSYKLEKDPAEVKTKRFDLQRMDRKEMERIMMMKDRRGHNDYYEEEEIPQNSEIVTAIRRQPRKSFEEYRSQFNKQLQNNKERTNKSRRTNIQFIQKYFSVNVKDSEFLDNKVIEEKWDKILTIIHKKMQRIKSNFEQKMSLIGKVKSFEDAAVKLFNQRKEFKLLKNMNQLQQSTIFALILYYLTLPNQQTLHREILTFDQSTRQIFRKLSSEEDELKRILENLPYKESSFYWEKLIQCCREKSDCEHPAALDGARIQQFQAEFAGVVTQETLKKLRSGEWLDNTITSAVIEYLKQIQGANNYHGDGNFRACLFTHSQTAIFMNSQRDLGQNYSSYDKLIFLVNHDNLHWFVIAAYRAKMEIVVYDSLNTSPAVHNDYCNKIANKLKADYRKRGQMVEFKMENFFTTPSQSNTSDCGVFSMVNLIWAFDNPDARSNRFAATIIPEIRHSLFLFLLYLGYCRELQVVPRKDYFDILFRSSIYYRLQSQLHLKHFK